MKHFILAAVVILGLAAPAWAYGPSLGLSLNISPGVVVAPPPPPPPVYYYPYPPGYYQGYPNGYYARAVPPPYVYRHRHHHRDWD